MEQKRLNHLEQIPPDDWGKTPASVKKLVEEMAQRIEILEKQQAEVLAAHQQQKRENQSHIKKLIITPLTRPTLVLGRSHKKKKAVKNEGVRQVMKGTVGICTRSKNVVR